MTHEYSDTQDYTDYTYEAPSNASMLEHALDLVEDHKGKIAAIAGLSAVALLGVGLHGLNGGSNDPSRFEHSTDNITFTIKEGANIRVDPYADDEPAATKLDAPLNLTTTEGTYEHTEPSNGKWIGFKKDNAANLGTLNDNDGILWTNINNIEDSER